LSRLFAQPTLRRENPFDSDDNAFPSLEKTLARPKQVIDLTLNDDDDRDGDDDNATEVSWLRIT
jgi:hypothetical protein